MRISDWSSDVCSSDLTAGEARTLVDASLRSSWVGEDAEERLVSPGFSSPLITGGTECFASSTSSVTDVSEPPCSSISISTSMEPIGTRSEEHTSELQSLMRHSYAVFCLKNKTPRKLPSHYTN